MIFGAVFSFFLSARTHAPQKEPVTAYSGRLTPEVLAYISSPGSDRVCGACLASAENFMNEKKLTALDRKTKDMYRVPAGEHFIGSPDGQGDPDERPQRRVHLDSFYIDKYETTITEYMKFADAAGNYYPDWARPNGQFNLDTGKQPYYRPLTGILKNCGSCPVVGVAQKDAEVYCGSRNKRLPTEAEWEAAARGGTGTLYSFGDSPADAGNYSWNETNSGENPHPVGTKKPNSYGLYDMHGNVWEWTADRYDKNYYRGAPRRNPPGPERGDERVIRGGSWAFDIDSMRAANRAGTEKPNDDIGFRCAVSESAINSRE